MCSFLQPLFICLIVFLVSGSLPRLFLSHTDDLLPSILFLDSCDDFLLIFFILLSVYISRPLPILGRLYDIDFCVLLSAFKLVERWMFTEVRCCSSQSQGEAEPVNIVGPSWQRYKPPWACWALCLDRTAISSTHLKEEPFAKAWLRPEALPFLIRGLCYPAQTALHLELY